MNTPNYKPQWIVGLNTIRFILAFIVLVGHTGDNPINKWLKESTFLPLKTLGYAFSVSFNGPAAVVGFFVISGFVIHYPNRNGIQNLRQYYIRRYVRVVIPMLVILFIGSFIGNPEIGIMWSLFCELIYYTIYPALLKWKVSWNFKLFLSVVIYLILLVVFCAGDFLSMVHQRNEGYSGEYVQLGTGLRWLVGLPAWLAGVKLADSITSYNAVVSKYKLLGFRLMIFACMTVAEIMRFHLFVSYIFSLNLLIVPLYYWLRAEIEFHKQNKPIHFLERWGRFSYSLYLCHPILLFVIPEIIAINIYTLLPFIAFIIAASWIFYKLVEEQSHILGIRLSRNLQKAN